MAWWWSGLVVVWGCSFASWSSLCWGGAGGSRHKGCEACCGCLTGTHLCGELPFDYTQPTNLRCFGSTGIAVHVGPARGVGVGVGIAEIGRPSDDSTWFDDPRHVLRRSSSTELSFEAGVKISSTGLSTGLRSGGDDDPRSNSDITDLDLGDLREVGTKLKSVNKKVVNPAIIKN